MADSTIYYLFGLLFLSLAAIIVYFKNEPLPLASSQLIEIFPSTSFEYWKDLSSLSPTIRKQKLEELKSLIFYLKENRFSFPYRAYKKALILEHDLVRFERNLAIEKWFEESSLYRIKKEELTRSYIHKALNKKQIYFISDYITELSKEAARLEKEYKALHRLLNRQFVFSIKY